MLCAVPNRLEGTFVNVRLVTVKFEIVAHVVGVAEVPNCVVYTSDAQIDAILAALLPMVRPVPPLSVVIFAVAAVNVIVLALVFSVEVKKVVP